MNSDSQYITEALVESDVAYKHLVVQITTQFAISLMHGNADTPFPSPGSRIQCTVAAFTALMLNACRACLLIRLPAGYTNAGIFLSLSIVLAGLLWPALLALPYMLIFLRQAWCWSCNRRHPVYDASVLRLLQQYTGDWAHLSFSPNAHSGCCEGHRGA